MKKLVYITAIGLLAAGPVMAQQKQQAQPNNAARKDILQGNQYYRQSELGLAQDYYKQALAKDPSNNVARYNLGNTLYQGKQFEAAAEAYGNARGGSRAEQARALHNLGNTMMEQQQWDKAAEAYKEALKRNPNAADTRYNLAYAQEMLKKQQQNQQNKDKNKDNKNQDKNKNKDQKDKDQQNKDNKDKQDKDKQQDQKDQQNKDQKDKQDQRPQPQPSKISQKQAEQLLNAINNEERKVQDKMKKGDAVRVKMEKDW